MIALSEQIIANNYGNATDRHLDRRRVIHSINSVVLKVRLSEEADSRSFGAAAPAATFPRYRQCESWPVGGDFAKIAASPRLFW
jgi:hypothetical protein